tara:strand:- start:68 stop:799 length:732 start_codon:yes stop_codon:yes gene_type:complete
MAIDTIKSTAVLDGAIATADIADANITTAKIADDAVTADKLANAINTSIAAKATTSDVNTAVALRAPIATPTLTGDVTLSNGNLVVGTNGKGIDFAANADSSATGASTTSELLDDYEEGTWTLVLQGSSGSAGSWNQSGMVAKYTKIGNTVHFTGTSYLTNTGSYSGYAVINGLPFVSNSGLNMSAAAAGIPIGQFNSTNYMPLVIGGQSYMHIRKGQYGDATALYNEIGLNVRIIVSGTYFI